MDNYKSIYIYQSGFNNICENNITENAEGITFNGSYENNIIGNWIVKNDPYGIDLYPGSSDNVIYYNNFMDNKYQVFSTGSQNTWDNGYPNGGNYWSDYEERYPNATEIDDLGIMDTPYAIDENNTDRYPFEISLPRDISLNNVWCSKTVVGQNLFPVKIEVNILNQGNYKEYCNVTAYINMTPIGSQIITLPFEGSEKAYFQWNIFGYAKGSYNLSIIADTVPGELDTHDNTYYYGTIVIAMQGDITADGIVDVFDIVVVAASFGLSRGELNYSLNADIFQDDTVDIYDLVIVAAHFGEVYL